MAKTASVVMCGIANAATRLLYQNIRDKGRAETTEWVESVEGAVLRYFEMTSTSPGRRLAEALALFFLRLATVVLYEWAMLLSVSPFLTL